VRGESGAAAFLRTTHFAGIQLQLLKERHFHDLLQLAKIEGEWRIVNVLWVMNPDRPTS
jgi:hypothetical protein